MSLQRNDVRDKFLFNLDIYYVLSSRVNSSIKYDSKGNLYISQIYIYLKYYYHYYYTILFLFIFFFF